MVCFSKSLSQRETEGCAVERRGTDIRGGRFSSLPRPCPVAFYFVRASILNTSNEDIPTEISYGYPTDGGELSRQNPPPVQTRTEWLRREAKVSTRTGLDLQPRGAHRLVAFFASDAFRSKLNT